MKYTIKKWQGWCPHWVVGTAGSAGVIGFSSFYEALEHVKWAVRVLAEQREEQPEREEQP